MMNLKQIKETRNSLKSLEEKVDLFGNILYCQELMSRKLFAYNTINEAGEIVVYCYYDSYRLEEEVLAKGRVSWEGVPYLLRKQQIPVGMANPLQISLARKVLEKYKKVMANQMS